MNVKLVTQVLSHSFADGWLICTDNLKLAAFQGVHAEVKFIRNSTHVSKFLFKMLGFSEQHAGIKKVFQVLPHMR